MATDSAAVEVALVTDSIDPGPLWERIANDDCGAHAVFLGKTRRHTAGQDAYVRETQQLCYDAYQPMAERQLQILAERAVERFGLRRVILIHRLGPVAIGEASVAVAASSPHRAAVFEALSWIMDQLKADVPIWKEEHYVDGRHEWVHGSGDETRSGDGRTDSSPRP